MRKTFHIPIRKVSDRFLYEEQRDCIFECKGPRKAMLFYKDDAPRV